MRTETNVIDSIINKLNSLRKDEADVFHNLTDIDEKLQEIINWRQDGWL